MKDKSQLDILEDYLKAKGYHYHRLDIDANEDGLMERHRITVTDANGSYLWDVICQPYSYGYEHGLLELAGSIAEPNDDVEGWLEAQDIINRIHN